MRRLDLQEYVPSGPHWLSPDELAALLREAKSLDLSIRPTANQGMYALAPGSTVGGVEVGGLSVFIEPKIGISQLLSLACYAIGRIRFQKTDFDFPEHTALPDALALALTAAARRAFARGLLHGYLTEEEALQTVRGRIRFDEQIRRRFGVPLPVEVRYDEFTDDILANRLVKAAGMWLAGMRLRSPEARRGLGWVAAMLDNVSYAEFPPGDVPQVKFDRLNDHYRGVVTLARLVLRRGAFEAGRGEVRASGFLMDMNQVFQEFVTVALREALGVSDRTFGEYGIPSLDEEGRVRLRPDLAWRDGSSCVFVGDAKYKNVTGERVPNADLYQLLAYTTALNLPGGLLVYAKGEANTATYTVRRAGKRLEVVALDLSGTLEGVRERVRVIAGRVWALREEARQTRRVA
ncbi:MAG: restriction endonuclease [Chloroflexi bacterium]|nr:restriction endonuclease [Chloroflexota bacterium]